MGRRKLDLLEGDWGIVGQGNHLEKPPEPLWAHLPEGSPEATSSSFWAGFQGGDPAPKSTPSLCKDAEP